MEEWYKIRNIHDIDSPALVVYPDRVKENIALIKSLIGDPDRLRPHVKTHKSADVTLLMLEAGLSKFKCATIAEAEMLATVNAPDVLLAYQPIGPKIQRFISLIKQYPATKFSCLVDDKNAAQHIAAGAAEGGITIPVFIDLNVGMNRTGILPASAVDLYEFCLQLKGMEPVGLHAYDGHIVDEDLATRTTKADEAFASVEKIKRDLLQKGYEEPVIVAGGSPTFPVHIKRENVECSPGTFIYWDAGYAKKYKEQPFLPAALVISRIISLPDETTICTDLGHKSIASENVLANRVQFLNAPDLEFIGHSEEHLVLRAEKGHRYKIGDVLYGMPVHVCPTCALYEIAFTVEGGIVTGEWKIAARDRKISL
ncbi:D-TA family PLP-dependent enzyme [Terrimonas alba]|uniref:D-TA family PLP-dependent enzyme n=1 Tax=Terrimonas alba TaxID=3349636 RepID=UPI0035F4FCDC